MATETRMDILAAARRLFVERGYAATSIADIAQSAGVAVQTIYSRLGSKSGIVLGLLDLVDAEADAPAKAAATLQATTSEELIKGAVHIGRSLAERCGDIITVMLAAASSEPAAAEYAAEGRRRNQAGTREVIRRVAQLGDLRADLRADHAAAVLATATFPTNVLQLVNDHGLTWDEAENLLTDTLTHALLASR